MTDAKANLPSTATTGTKTLTSGSSLPDNLRELLLSGETRVVGPKTAAMLSAFAEAPEPEPADMSVVETMIGRLAMATAQAKISDDEAAARLDIYWLALRDIPTADLRAAYVELVRTAKFLPTPAEVRTAALKAGSARRYAKSRARHLAWLHTKEWQPPVEAISAEEIAALKAGAAQALRRAGDGEAQAA